MNHTCVIGPDAKRNQKIFLGFGSDPSGHSKNILGTACETTQVEKYVGSDRTQQEIGKNMCRAGSDTARN